MRRREHVHQSFAYNIVYIIHTCANQRDTSFFKYNANYKSRAHTYKNYVAMSKETNSCFKN